MKYCEKCGKSYSDEIKFCQSCGGKVVAEQTQTSAGKVCPKCKRTYPESENFCKVCGAALDGQGSAKKKGGIIIAVIVAVLVFVTAAAAGFILFSKDKKEDNRENQSFIREESSIEQQEEAEDVIAHEGIRLPDPPAPQPQNETAEADLPPEDSQEIPSVIQARHSSYSATSALAEYDMVHSAERAFDGDVSTAWVEGVSGNGIGESVSVYFDGTCWINGFSIYAGYHKNEDLYYKNSRPSELTVTFSDGTTETIFLNDVYAVQDIALSHPVAAEYVTFTVSGAYSGHKYEDTVISEISFY